MITLNDYCKNTFGKKLYKLSLNGGMTCPNRDGTLGTRGCIFCSSGGSGDFTADCRQPIENQIEEAKQKIAGKYHGNSFIAYFQAYTNTYAPVPYLEKIFRTVIERDDIYVLDIATRPDCLGDDVLKLLEKLNRIKPVWVELGLQTSKPGSIEYIRRGYRNEVYRNAIGRLNDIGIHTVTHIILGLPGENTEDMLTSVRYAVDCGTGGLKLQMLHILEGTDLADDYRAGKFEVLSLDKYMEILKKCVEIIPDGTVVHRLTGDGAKKDLIAPLWSGDKKTVMNRIKRELNLK